MPQKTAPNPSPTVLVVDDEEHIRQVARRILEEEGYHVTEVSNGLDALALLEGGMALDLLMADLDMPGLGGAKWSGGFAQPGRICGFCTSPVTSIG